MANHRSLGTPRRARRIGLALFGLLLLGPAPAAAQATDAGADELRTAARDRYRQGRQLLQEGHPVEALQELAASYQLFPSWASLYGMAMCQEAMSRPEQALELYRQALREGGAGLPEADRADIETRIADLQTQLALTAPAFGVLEVRSDPVGAEVRIDGTSRGVAPLEVELPPGSHTVELAQTGRETVVRTVEITVDQRVALRATLPEAAAPAAPPGRLVVDSEPAGTVFVDEQPVRAGEPMELPAGPHEVRVEGLDGAVWRDSVEIPSGRTVTVAVRLGASEGIDSLWFWLATGLAGGLAVTGAGTGGYVLALEDEYYDPATSAGRRQEIKDAGDPLRVATDALFGTAGVFAVGALVLAFFTDFSGGTGGGGVADVLLEAEPEASGVDAAGLAALRW